MQFTGCDDVKLRGKYLNILGSWSWLNPYFILVILKWVHLLTRHSTYQHFQMEVSNPTPIFFITGDIYQPYVGISYQIF